MQRPKMQVGQIVSFFHPDYTSKHRGTDQYFKVVSTDERGIVVKNRVARYSFFHSHVPALMCDINSPEQARWIGHDAARRNEMLTAVVLLETVN
jgi:hypothetical protein